MLRGQLEYPAKVGMLSLSQEFLLRCRETSDALLNEGVPDSAWDLISQTRELHCASHRTLTERSPEESGSKSPLGLDA